MSIDIRHMTDRLWGLEGTTDFNALALEIFHQQVSHCAPYRTFCTSLGRTEVQSLADIPYLPIDAFKRHTVLCEGRESVHEFTSSGTTSTLNATHHVADLDLYERSFMTSFEHEYGAVQNHCILALLPSYLERSGSSLVYMVDKLIARSAHVDSGFYLDELAQLGEKLAALKERGQSTILFGVSFALLDMIELFQLDFPELTIIETGGMKGRRKELTREELHQRIQTGFNVSQVHSEYGMTELLSQAYSKGAGLFTCPPWMKVSVRQVDDPFSLVAEGKTGGLNIIDLTNIHSCSFIASDDLGRIHTDGQFEVLGRFDHSDIRGCSLLAI